MSSAECRDSSLEHVMTSSLQILNYFPSNSKLYKTYAVETTLLSALEVASVADIICAC